MCLLGDLKLKSSPPHCEGPDSQQHTEGPKEPGIMSPRAPLTLGMISLFCFWFWFYKTGSQCKIGSQFSPGWPQICSNPPASVLSAGIIGLNLHTMLGFHFVASTNHCLSLSVLF